MEKYIRTAAQVENTKMLIQGLKRLPATHTQLVMADFVDGDTRAALEGNLIGQTTTYADILGHAPSFEIFVPEDLITEGERGEICTDWREFGERIFGFMDVFSGFDDPMATDWEFCFSALWPDCKYEAIARLEMANAGKIPLKWDLSDRYTRS